jgi:hypothetical protein
MICQTVFGVCQAIGGIGNVKCSRLEILVADVDFLACGAFPMDLVGL